MRTNKQEICSAVAEVCNASSLKESLNTFRHYQHLLCDCKFLFAASEGSIPGLPVGRNFSATGAIRCLFKTGKILFLDRVTLKEMDDKGNASSFTLDYSISLDSQAVRYLKPYIQGTLSRVPEDFVEVFKFIARPEINIDPIPYLYENLLKPNSIPDYDKIFYCYKDYELLKTIDYDYFLACGQIRSTESDKQLNIRTQKLLSSILHEHNDGNKETLEFWIDIYYCLILEMVIINFECSKLSTEQKTQKFLEFMDQELATICVREAVVACKFFEIGNKLEFFSTMQKNNPKILKKIRNMAWDFWHIRYVESLATNPFNEFRYFFPSLLTFDKSFVEIIDLCPLKAIAYIEGIIEPIPFYEDEVIKKLEGLCNMEYYFSDKEKKSRNNRQGNVKNNLKNLINKLESEVTNSCVPQKF